MLHSHPLCWIDGRQASLCVLTDVTEERRARELIAKHRDAAHRTARLIALGEFASAVAHELNQPLAAIATYNHSCMRMLQSGKPDPEQLLQAMHICRDQAKRAGRIIQRLRGLLRHPGPALAEQNLNELVAAVLELSEPDARDAGVTFERALSARPPLVRADRLLIEQAALNLVRNAVEAVQELPPERRRVTVATRIEADGSGTLAVSDLGDGVPAEMRERLFDAFVTTKRGGLGLGLSICRSVVEAHGGAIQHERTRRAARASRSPCRDDATRTAWCTWWTTTTRCATRCGCCSAPRTWRSRRSRRRPRSSSAPTSSGAAACCSTSACRA